MNWKWYNPNTQINDTLQINQGQRPICTKVSKIRRVDCISIKDTKADYCWYSKEFDNVAIYRRVGLSSALRYLVHILYLAHTFFLSQTWVYTLSGAHTPIKRKVGGIIDSCSFSKWHVSVSTVCMHRSLDGLVCTLSCCRTAPWLGSPVLSINSSFKRNLNTLERGKGRSAR